MKDTESSQIENGGYHGSLSDQHKPLDAHLHLARADHIRRGAPARSVEIELTQLGDSRPSTVLNRF